MAEYEFHGTITESGGGGFTSDPFKALVASIMIVLIFPSWGFITLAGIGGKIIVSFLYTIGFLYLIFKGRYQLIEEKAEYYLFLRFLWITFCSFLFTFVIYSLFNILKDIYIYLGLFFLFIFITSDLTRNHKLKSLFRLIIGSFYLFTGLIALVSAIVGIKEVQIPSVIVGIIFLYMSYRDFKNHFKYRFKTKDMKGMKLNKKFIIPLVLMILFILFFPYIKNKLTNTPEETISNKFNVEGINFKELGDNIGDFCTGVCGNKRLNGYGNIVILNYVECQCEGEPIYIDYSGKRITHEEVIERICNKKKQQGESC